MKEAEVTHCTRSVYTSMRTIYITSVVNIVTWLSDVENYNCTFLACCSRVCNGDICAQSHATKCKNNNIKAAGKSMKDHREALLGLDVLAKFFSSMPAHDR